MCSSFTLEKATNNILAGGFKPGWGQAYAECEDARHPGQKVGVGVYCSPNPYVMESYASYAQTSTCINGINFMMGFMMRVKPERIRYSNSMPDYWVLDGTKEEMTIHCNDCGETFKLSPVHHLKYNNGGCPICRLTKIVKCIECGK